MEPYRLAWKEKTNSRFSLGFVLFLFGADNRTCSERSERNSETGEFIRYREASALNKLCLSHNRALHGHYVFYLFAMSAVLDVRKCFALAALFACGQLQKCRLQTKFADNAVRLVASLLSVQWKEKRTNKRFVFLGNGADNRTWTCMSKCSQEPESCASANSAMSALRWYSILLSRQCQINMENLSVAKNKYAKSKRPHERTAYFWERI